LADEQASELVRDLSRFRFIVAGIRLLARHFAQVAMHHWAESR
jgi:hypothetical protein